MLCADSDLRSLIFDPIYGNAAIQEYEIDINAGAGVETYRVISMAPVDENGKQTGERLYCDEGFVRHLLGPLFDLCEPI